MNELTFKKKNKAILKELGHMLLKHRFDTNHDYQSLMIDNYNNMTNFLFKLLSKSIDDIERYKHNTFAALHYHKEKDTDFF